MSKISIQDIAKTIATKHGLIQNEAETFVTTLFDVINEGLHGDNIVKVKGLGTFKVIDVRERESVNVNTGERVVIESHKKVTFTPDAVMRDLVNKPFAQFETVILNDGVDLEEMGKTQEAEMQDEEQVFDDSEKDIEEDIIPDDTIETKEETLSEDDNNNVDAEEQEPTYEDETSIVEEQETVEIGIDDNDIFEQEDEIESDEPIQEQADKQQADEPFQQEGESSCLPVSEDLSQNMENASTEDSGNKDKDKRLVLLGKKIIYVLIVAFVGAFGLIVGFYWGRSSVQPIVRYKSVNVARHSVAMQKTDTIAHRDTTALAKAVEKKRDTVATKKGIAKPVQESTDIPATDDSPSMNRARTMVKTGAYRIIGTAKTVTVRKGETLKKISKFYLGDGMECYVQVHNGILEVKEGLKLKIPKLENKLRSRSKNR